MAKEISQKVARDLQERHPDLSYQTALRFAQLSRLEAEELVRSQPELKFREALLQCAERKVR